MAVSDISLTSGMRSNLLSLQGTVDLLNRTQNRLSTGKKVNSAIDNPTSYFASQSLTSRASLIDSLKDAMGQAVQTVTAADKGITSITAMIEQAKGIAQSALSADNGGAVGGEISIINATMTDFVAGTVDLTLSSVTVGQTIKLTDAAGNVHTLTAGTADDTANLTFKADGTDAQAATGVAACINTLTDYTATAALGVVTISKTLETVSTGSITGTAVTGGTATAAPNANEVLGDTITLTDQAGTVTTLMAGRDFTEGANAAATALAVMNVINTNTATTGYTAQLDVDDVTKVKISKDGENITTGDIAGTALTDHFTVAEFDTGAETERSALVSQYNEMRTQIDELAQDAGYKGKNLLYGATAAERTLTVKFEGSTLDVVGFDASTGTSGLNVTAANSATTKWTADGATGTTAINTSIDQLDNALDTLRQKASQLAGNLSIITVRQNFSTNMINTLTEGSDKLTLADTNEEGANMLMLQTRQSLSTTALSLSAQAAQSVLKLFG